MSRLMDDLQKKLAPVRYIHIEAHPFDQGYWARYFNLPKPETEEGIAGYESCAAEIAAEMMGAGHDE